MNDILQFPFEFIEDISFEPEDFIVSKANRDAFNYIKNYQTWSKENQHNQLLAVVGPHHSGKTHLSYVFSSITQAKFIQIIELFSKRPEELIDAHQCYILEDLDKILDNDEIIFHLINEVTQKQATLLITSAIALPKLNVKLLDLRSRLSAISSIEIHQPDDELIRTLLIKLFSDKQIRISTEVINYISSNAERSFKEINNIVDYIDKKSIIEKRKITLSLVKEVFNYLEKIKN